MKVLIVDDEELIRNVIKEYCKFENYLVDEASDGAEAITKVEQNNYDIIIMDIMMPHIDGFKAVEQIKNIKNIPVIMLTARSEELDKLNGFSIGIDDYITKPFSPKELMARIKAVTKRNNKDEIITSLDIPRSLSSSSQASNSAVPILIMFLSFLLLLYFF